MFGEDVSVLKMFVFPVWGHWGGHILVYLGLESLGVLCSLFVFFVFLLFVLFCLCWSVFSILGFSPVVSVSFRRVFVLFFVFLGVV